MDLMIYAQGPSNSRDPVQNGGRLGRLGDCGDGIASQGLQSENCCCWGCWERNQVSCEALLVGNAASQLPSNLMSGQEMPWYSKCQNFQFIDLPPFTSHIIHAYSLQLIYPNTKKCCSGAYIFNILQHLQHLQPAIPMVTPKQLNDE